MHLMLLTLFVFAVEWKTHLCQCTCRTRVLDLTHPFDKHVESFPSIKNFRIDAVKYFDNNPNIPVEEYSSSTHAGTHFDAPRHFFPNAPSVTDIPVEKLIAPVAVVDIQKKVHCDPDYQLQVQDLREWELKTGQVLKDIVLMRTGWSKRWLNKTAYIGNTNNDKNNLHFPGISVSAACWLAKKRNVYIVGVDTLTPDYGPSKNFPVYRTFLGNKIYILVNVDVKDELPLYGATLYVMPMKIGDSSGAPARIVATFPETIFNDC